MRFGDRRENRTSPMRVLYNTHVVIYVFIDYFQFRNDIGIDVLFTVATLYNIVLHTGAYEWNMLRDPNYVMKTVQWVKTKNIIVDSDVTF